MSVISKDIAQNLALPQFEGEWYLDLEIGNYTGVPGYIFKGFFFLACLLFFFF